MEKAAIYLPIVAAIFWGASYAVFERALENITVTTWLLVGGTASICVSFFLSKTGLPPIDLKPLLAKDVLMIVALTIVLAKIADISTIYAIKYVNATYAAVGEISYMIFVPVFSWLIYGYRNFNMSTILGGLIVFIGVLIVVRGQYLSVEGTG